VKLGTLEMEERIEYIGLWGGQSEGVDGDVERATIEGVRRKEIWAMWQEKSFSFFGNTIIIMGASLFFLSRKMSLLRFY